MLSLPVSQSHLCDNLVTNFILHGIHIATKCGNTGHTQKSQWLPCLYNLFPFFCFLLHAGYTYSNKTSWPQLCLCFSSCSLLNLFSCFRDPGSYIREGTRPVLFLIKPMPPRTLLGILNEQTKTILLSTQLKRSIPPCSHQIRKLHFWNWPDVWAKWGWRFLEHFVPILRHLVFSSSVWLLLGTYSTTSNSGTCMSHLLLQLLAHSLSTQRADTLCCYIHSMFRELITCQALLFPLGCSTGKKKKNEVLPLELTFTKRNDNKWQGNFWWWCMR